MTPAIRWSCTWLLLVAALGCRATSPPPSTSDAAPVEAPPEVPPSPASRTPAEEPADAQPTAPPEVVLRGHGDVDADGTDDSLALHDDGTLAAGTLRGLATWTGADPFWMERQAKLYVAAFDRAHDQRVVVLELPDLSDEDPPNRIQIFIIDRDGLRRVWDWLPTGYGPVELELRGDGRVQYVEDGWTACERVDPSVKAVPRQRVTLRLTGEPGAQALTEVERAASGRVQDCSLLAACPMVVLVERGSETEVGEILRGLRGAAAYDRQALRLVPPREGVLHLRIVEHKPEVTFLDAVMLRVDGREILPRTCGHEPEPAHCAPDRSATRLTQGESIDLWFDVPPGAGTVDLVAWGHYIATRRALGEHPAGPADAGLVP